MKRRRLNEATRNHGLRLAQGARFMGQPLERYCREDLLAIAAIVWHAHKETLADAKLALEFARYITA